MQIKEVYEQAINRFQLNPNGIHGTSHWARVIRNGMRISYLLPLQTDRRVVMLFGLLHDTCRVSDGEDPEHGLRSSEFASSIKELLGLDPEQRRQLVEACYHHSHDGHFNGSTMQSCLDSDRLDLGRCGVTPDPSRLYTKIAKNADFIAESMKNSNKEFDLVDTINKSINHIYQYHVTTPKAIEKIKINGVSSFNNQSYWCEFGAIPYWLKKLKSKKTDLLLLRSDKISTNEILPHKVTGKTLSEYTNSYIITYPVHQENAQVWDDGWKPLTDSDGSTPNINKIKNIEYI